MFIDDLKGFKKENSNSNLIPEEKIGNFFE
jgi:hypothetical protein